MALLRKILSESCILLCIGFLSSQNSLSAHTDIRVASESPGGNQLFGSKEEKRQMEAKAEAKQFAQDLKGIVLQAKDSFSKGVMHLQIVKDPLETISAKPDDEADSFYYKDQLSALFSNVRASLDGIDDKKGAAIHSSIDATVPDDRALYNASSKRNARLIPKRSGDRMIDAVGQFLDNLFHATLHITLDLTVLASPDPGNVTITSTNGAVEFTGTTSHTIRNIYRGFYKIVIVRDGYKTVVDKKDFLNQAGDTLDCHDLIKTSDAQTPGHCDLQ
jgi:hypothetical protein